MTNFVQCFCWRFPNELNADIAEEYSRSAHICRQFTGSMKNLDECAREACCNKRGWSNKWSLFRRRTHDSS